MSEIRIRFDSQPDLAQQLREPLPDRALTEACNWLVLHPRWAAALICALCVSAGWVDRVMP